MTNIPKLQAKELIHKLVDEIPKLKRLSQGRDSHQFQTWEIYTPQVICRIFGEQSPYLKRFQEIYFYPLSYNPSEDENKRRRERYETFVQGLDRASAILNSMLNELEEFWPDETAFTSDSQQIKTSSPIATNKIFVVHGRDIGTKDTVTRFLESLELNLIVLQEQPDRGMTVIEKFEEYGGQSGFAVVLCTPDDVGGLDGQGDATMSRARQNVIFELGFFVGKIGRSRVMLMVKDDIEIPSDFAGVLYTDVDDAGAWKLKMIKELKTAGFSIDANRVL